MADIHDAQSAINGLQFREARMILRELIEAGDPEAHYLFGQLCSAGQGGPEDKAAAVEHYRLASGAGHAEATYNLAAMHALGSGVEQDFGKALQLYRQSAEAGDADAMFKVGVMLANGQGVAVQMTEAVEWWQRATEQEHAQAALFLGHAFLDGDGVDVDIAQSADWYLRSSQYGEEGGFELAMELRPRLEELADKGSAVAQHALGIIFKYGMDSGPQAIKMLEAAARQEHAGACRVLGYCYDHGEDVPEDKLRARQLFLTAAEQGDLLAQFNLGLSHFSDDESLEQDIDQAVLWLRRAVNQGMHDALIHLAEALAYRNRDRRDANEALQRLSTLAADGDPQQTYELVARDGEWTISISQNGQIVTSSIPLGELVGLPDDYE